MNRVKMFSKVKISSLIVLLGLVFLTGCYDVNQKADLESTYKDPNVEYAPQMYHSEPYEPLSQINDTTAGTEYWPFTMVGTDVKHGEWFNSNYYNPHGINMREPAANTIPFKNDGSSLPYSIHKDSLGLADAQPDMAVLTYETVDSTLKLTADGTVKYKEGEVLYTRYCSHCHGSELDGKGPVSQQFQGIASLKAQGVKLKTASYIYHVITQGKGKMQSHASQVSVEDRWLISAYIKEVHRQSN